MIDHIFHYYDFIEYISKIQLNISRTFCMNAGYIFYMQATERLIAPFCSVILALILDYK